MNYARSKAWTYHRKPRKRGRWAYRPLNPLVIAAYFRGVWDEMMTRKSIFQILKERSNHV